MVRFAWDKPFFKDREEAAELLAAKLSEYKGKNPLVLAVPRGAVNMGRLIVKALGGELDVVLVHKIGAPDNPELAVGAVSERGEVYTAPYAVSLGISEKDLEKEAARQLETLKERRRLYTPAPQSLRVAGRVVILVDDGIATGATMLAAIRELRHQAPIRVVVAAAVAPPDTFAMLKREADEVVLLAMPDVFGAVGEFFENFSQVTDAEVIRILKGQAGREKVK